MSNSALELVSFKLCPYVQRSVITLKYKKAPYKITYIDLANPPEWFEKISPMGQVPVLVVSGTPIFESAVINEYIDETVGARLHPTDPLRRAFERAWIEYGSNLLGQSYMMFKAADRAELKGLMDEFFTDLQRLEDVVSKEGPYFRGREFSLVDAAYAPLFMRLFLVPLMNPDSPKADPRWKSMPRVAAWARAMLSEPAVRESVGPEFTEEYLAYCRKQGSVLLQG